MQSSLTRAVCAAALAALLASCSTSTSTSSSTASSTEGPSSAGAAKIKIGIDLPVSGADTSDGQPTANGAILAIEDANAHGFAGGKYTLEPDLLDDAVQGKHDPAAGAQNTKTFISDGAVLAMIGPFNSNVAKSEIPLSNDAGLAQISPANTNDALTVGPDAKTLRSAHPDRNAYFRVCTRDAKQGAALAQYAKKLGWKHVYLIDDNETYGKGLADVFDASFRSGGGTVAGHDHVTANQQDFKSLLTKAKATHPDAVFFGGTTSTGGALIRRQMGDVGMGTLPYMGGDGISGTEFITVAGDAANGTYYTFAAPDAAKLPQAASFLSAYKKRFNADVGAYSASGYAAAQVAIAAIGKAISTNGGKLPTRADVLSQVAATKDFASLIGPIGFDANGDTTAPVLTVKQIKDGKAVTVDQLTLKS